MPDIKDQKLLYHLTSIDNAESIFTDGLKPRSELSDFKDIADAGIIESRKYLALETYVPFHWFAKNPFDGRVQKNQSNEAFVLICVQRSLAQAKNWKIIPRHPLASQTIELMDYVEGFAAIDWDTMNRRDYHDPDCKSVCMAECLSPDVVLPSDSNVFVCNETSEERIRNFSAQISITVNPNMFVR